MKNLTQIVFSSILAMLLFACDPLVPPTPTDQNGKIKVEWELYAGDDRLTLNTGSYVTAGNDTITLDKFRYYISNIKLKKADGTYFTYPRNDSYFLIDAQSAPSQIMELVGIPLGDYTEISFLLGIDSLKNYSPSAEHVGILSPDKGMYWTWNTGYIFWKLEGGFKQNQKFVYHIGGAGYGGTSNNSRNIILPLTGANKLTISQDKKPEVHVRADVLKVFTGAEGNIDMGTTFEVMDFGRDATALANNAANMFSISLVHNP